MTLLPGEPLQQEGARVCVCATSCLVLLLPPAQELPVADAAGVVSVDLCKQHVNRWVRHVDDDVRLYGTRGWGCLSHASGQSATPRPPPRRRRGSVVHHPAPIGAMMRAGSTGRGSVTLSNRPPSLAAWIMLHGIMPKFMPSWSICGRVKRAGFHFLAQTGI